MIRYSIEPKTKKYIKRYGFLSFAKSLSNKYGKQLLDTATKTGEDALIAASKKAIHKTTAATEKFIGNKISDAMVKTEENSRNDEEILIPLEEKIEEILNKLRKVF